MKFTILLVLFAVQSVFAATSIPETPQGSAKYKELQDIVAAANKNSVHFTEVSINGMQGTLSFRTQPTDVKNQLSAILVLGKKIFLIPAKFASIDNFHRFYTSAGGGGEEAGVYMVLSGFRVDTTLDRPARVVAQMRIADQDGNPLSTLEYDERLTQAQSLDFLETHARTNFSSYLLPAKTNRAFSLVTGPEQKPDYLIEEDLPGSPYYMRTTAALDHAQGWDQIWYLDFDFAKIKGRMAVPSSGIIVDNNLEVYFQINGHAYQIPIDFWYIDNWTSFTAEPNGIYMTQRGFRFGTSTKNLFRVISRIRIADAGGNVLSKLEYHEDVTPADTSRSTMLLERDFY